MARDPQAAALALVHRKRSVLTRCERATVSARQDYRKALADANAAGVSLSELARQLHTSPARIRELVAAA